MSDNKYKTPKFNLYVLNRTGTIFSCYSAETYKRLTPYTCGKHIGFNYCCKRCLIDRIINRTGLILNKNDVAVALRLFIHDRSK